MQYIQKLCNIIKVFADYKIMLLPCKVWEEGRGLLGGK
jgi:hypothetical protein